MKDDSVEDDSVEDDSVGDVSVGDDSVEDNSVVFRIASFTSSGRPVRISSVKALNTSILIRKVSVLYLERYSAQTLLHQMLC